MPHDLLLDAVKAFYAHLSAGRYAECYRMVDPQVRAFPEGVALAEYGRSLALFAEHVTPPLFIDDIELTAKLGDGNKLYDGRDFAFGRTLVRDGLARPHRFTERWVLEDGLWYTRCVGFANNF